MPSPAPHLEAKPALLPGQRYLRDEVIIFNLDLMNAAIADIAIDTAPADLSSLSDVEVSSLVLSYINASSRRRHDPAVVAFGVRIHAERAKRPALVSAYRGAA